MRGFVTMSVALCLGAASVASGERQAVPKAAVAGQAPRASQAAAIQWTAGLGLAMKRMGADTRPVILYFTFDT
jgi:hypothetical protein